MYTNLEMNQPVERNGNTSYRDKGNDHQKLTEEQNTSNNEYNNNEKSSRRLIFSMIVILKILSDSKESPQDVFFP